ncbi:MAG: hypothetical protein JWP91_836 [Fibrobacteres bacterium]|nr:hypothetical protein [Fibrobacterota bacterium]
MRARTIFQFLMAAVMALMIPGPALAAKAQTQTASAPVDALNQKKIHSDYNEGNFEKVTKDLEAFMSRNKTYSLEDSVFIAKHLAVVYSANPETREKGKYYMYRLLTLLPSAKLIDMYVSDEIDRIFDKVREEFMTRQKSFGVDSTQISLPAKSSHSQPEPDKAVAAVETPRTPAPGTEAKPRSKAKPVYFIAGGAALVVAAGVTSYFLLNDEPETTEHVYVIP